MDQIKKFIDIYMPIKQCNLSCHYCYITDSAKKRMEDTKFLYSSELIGKALDKERLGGICHFNICGYGETMIPKELIGIVYELLKNGHYVMIVTNGLITERIKEILTFPENLLRRLGFKFSFHYLELKRTNQLEKFIKNIEMVKDFGCSFSVEITPSDELEPYIDEIKRFSLSSFGALPHITIPRNSDANYSLRSKRTLDEFQKVWAVFDSELFNFKLSTWNIKRKEYCYAGDWSGLLNIGNGELSTCYGVGYTQNIFKDINKPIHSMPVGKKCMVPHCVNSHVFLTLGNIPSINYCTYDVLRNRVCLDGSNWLNPEMRSFLSGRLENNNRQYSRIEKFKLLVIRKIRIFTHFICIRVPKLLKRKLDKLH